MRTVWPDQSVKGKELAPFRTSNVASLPLFLNCMSMLSVANHDHAFGIKIMPTIDRTYPEKERINQHLPNNMPKVA